MLSRQSVGTHQVNELTRKSSGNARPESSQLAESRWPDPSPSSGTISVSGTDTLELTSVHLKKKKKKKKKQKKKVLAGNYSSNHHLSVILACKEKPHALIGQNKTCH